MTVWLRQNLHTHYGQYERFQRTKLLKREMNLIVMLLSALMAHKRVKDIGIWNSPAICKNNISISNLPPHHDADCLCSDFNLFSNICVNGFQKFLLRLLPKKSKYITVNGDTKYLHNTNDLLLLDKLSIYLFLLMTNAIIVIHVLHFITELPVISLIQQCP
jgi:hypothetical protein